MKTPKYLSLFMALAIGSTALTSCLGGDDPTDDYAGISYVNNAILGSMKRYIPFKKADGTDTVSVSTVTGSTYPLTIDRWGTASSTATPCPPTPTWTR